MSVSECSVCGHPWVNRGGEHAEWCERVTAVLREQCPPDPPTWGGCSEWERRRMRRARKAA